MQDQVKVPLKENEVIVRRSVQQLIQEVVNEGPHAIWSAYTSAGRYLKIVFERYRISMSECKSPDEEEVLLFHNSLTHATNSIDTTYMLKALSREGYVTE